jgi:hypothetical protein
MKGLKGMRRLKGLSYKRTAIIYFLVQKVSENPKIRTIDLKRTALEFYRKFEPDLTSRTIERDIKYAKEKGLFIIKKRRCKINLAEIKKYQLFSFLLPIGKHETDRFYSCGEVILSEVERFISPSDLWRKVKPEYRKIAAVSKLGRKTMAMSRTFDILIEICPQELNAALKTINNKTLRKQFERDITKMTKSEMLVFNSKKTKVKENPYMFFGEKPTSEEKKKMEIEELKMLELKKDIKKYGSEKLRGMKKWRGRFL